MASSPVVRARTWNACSFPYTPVPLGHRPPLCVQEIRQSGGRARFRQVHGPRGGLPATDGRRGCGVPGFLAVQLLPVGRTRGRVGPDEVDAASHRGARAFCRRLHAFVPDRSVRTRPRIRVDRGRPGGRGSASGCLRRVPTTARAGLTTGFVARAAPAEPAPTVDGNPTGAHRGTVGPPGTIRSGRGARPPRPRNESSATKDDAANLRLHRPGRR